MTREMGFEAQPLEGGRRAPGKPPRTEGPDLQILSTEHWSLRSPMPDAWSVRSSTSRRVAARC
jgi:hypothetical protein